MMDNHTLRKAFWLLKKYSSYTWAAEIQKNFTQFVNALETWMRSNPPDADEFEEEVLRRVWYMQGKAEEGLDLLKIGQDKSRAYSLLRQGFGFVDLFWSDRWFTDKHSDAFERLGFSSSQDGLCTGLFSTLGAASHMRVCYLSAPGLRSYKDLFDTTEWVPHKAKYHTPLWMPTDFAPLPTFAQSIEILSGDETPVTGIWKPEPIAGGEMTPEILKATGGQQTYCMNFMVQGTTAPKMISEEEHLLVMEQDYRPIPKDRTVRWRLLWKDERYGTNGIPEEEQDYLRVEEATAPSVSGSPDAGIIRCENGKPCPRTGFWWTPAKQGSRRKFDQGDTLPDFPDSQYGATIWYWDQKQD